MRALHLPSHAFHFFSLIRPSVYLLIIVAILFLGGGCTADQLALTQQSTSQLQDKIKASQDQLAVMKQQIDQEKAVLATQPATTQAVAQLAKDEAAVTKIQGWLDKTQPVVQQLNDAVTALKNGETPNFAGLGVFGPYGAVAGLVLSLGGLAWQTYSKSKIADTANAQAQTIAAQQPVIDHIQAATGTDNPVSAAAALAPTISALGVSKAEAIPPVVPIAPKSLT